MNLFSIQKENNHIVIKFLGIKINLKNHRFNPLEEMCQIPNLEYYKKQRAIFPHPIGIVISKNTIIGKDCYIYQNVTIGSWKDKSPQIGDNVYIYPNSVIIGGIKIGDNVKIAPCSLVRQDVPDNAIVAGNPAKIISINNKK